MVGCGSLDLDVPQKPHRFLLDRRDDGCGYDYELITNNSIKYIEVKGLAGNEGGMSFTAKEWEMAKKHQDDYFVVLVKNVGNEPSFLLLSKSTL